MASKVFLTVPPEVSMQTEKRKNFLINFSYFAILAVLAFASLRYVLPLVAPFAVAFLIAYGLKGPITFLRDRLHLPGKLSAIIAVILFYGMAGAILSLLSIRAFSGLAGLIDSLPTMYETHVLPFFLDILNNLEGLFVQMDPALVTALDEMGNQMIQSLTQLVSSFSVKVMSIATAVAAGVPGLFIKLVLMVISSFFIAVDYDRLTGFCLRQLGGGAKGVFFQIKEYVVGTLWVCIRSYALIMAITFVELSIGLSIIKIKHALLVAFIIALFDILPVLGTGGIMIPWTILTLVQGNYPRALGLLVIYLVITVIRNIIEPKIVGGQLGLHPVVTLCSMFVGAQLLGAIGLFGFPIGLSLLRHLNDHGVIKIFR